MSSGRSAPAIRRALTENDLIEEFHWLPQDIANIPYKSLQLFYLIRREKGIARANKAAIDELKSKQTKKSPKAPRRR